MSLIVSCKHCVNYEGAKITRDSSNNFNSVNPTCKASHALGSDRLNMLKISCKDFSQK